MHYSSCRNQQIEVSQKLKTLLIAKQKEKGEKRGLFQARDQTSEKRVTRTPVLQPPVLERLPLGRRRLVNLHRPAAPDASKPQDHIDQKEEEEKKKGVRGEKRRIHGGEAGTARRRR